MPEATVTATVKYGMADGGDEEVEGEEEERKKTHSPGVLLCFVVLCCVVPCVSCFSFFFVFIFFWLLFCPVSAASWVPPAEPLIEHFHGDGRVG